LLELDADYLRIAPRLLLTFYRKPLDRARSGANWQSKLSGHLDRGVLNSSDSATDFWISGSYVRCSLTYKCENK
jgi:hypothetical protein